jgi:hypothetical protein
MWHENWLLSLPELLVSQNVEIQTPFVTTFTKESLCTIRLFKNTKMSSSTGILTISKVSYHHMVAMTHTHLSIVIKLTIFI